MIKVGLFDPPFNPPLEWYRKGLEVTREPNAWGMDAVRRWFEMARRGVEEWMSEGGARGGGGGADRECIDWRAAAVREAEARDGNNRLEDSAQGHERFAAYFKWRARGSKVCSLVIVPIVNRILPCA
jgi:hypothetical protein